jgi:hypothetical protein
MLEDQRECIEIANVGRNAPLQPFLRLVEFKTDSV